MRAMSLTAKFQTICTGSIVIMFLTCLIMFLRTSDDESNEIKQQWLLMVNDLESQIGTQFAERYGDVQVMALNTALHGQDPAAITRILNDYISIFDVYDLIVLVDLNGQVVASSTVDHENNPLEISRMMRQNFANTPWFSSVATERYSEDTKKGLSGAYVEDIMIDPLSSLVYRNKRIGLSFSTAVRDDKGKMVGVLTCRSSLRWIEHQMMDLYSGLKKDGLGSAELAMINKRGELVVDYDPSTQNSNGAMIHDFDNLLFKVNLTSLGNPAAAAATRGEEGTMLAMDSRKKTTTVFAYTGIRDEKFLEELGWSLIFSIDEMTLLGRILHDKQMFFVICGLVLGICVLGTGIFAVRLSRQLKEISQSIEQAGGSVDSVANQLSGASHDLSTSATEVASSLEETVSSLEELTSMVKSNAENAGEAAALAQNSSKVAKEGESEVQNLIGAISEINQSSKKIEEIITVIDDIAFQTNLLALNAAVEAARAGEQGKGFAVVAEAVRNLAQRSGTAAKEISGLIRDNVNKIDRGTKIADRSGQVLDSILNSVRKVADLNNEIAAASKEQSAGLSQISKAMNEIDQATQRNAAASEEVAASSEEMNTQAHTLQDMVHVLAEVVTGEQWEGEDGETPAETKRHSKPKKKPTLAGKREGKRAPGKGLHAVSSLPKKKSHAESIIPFDEDDEPPAKISSTAGF